MYLVVGLGNPDKQYLNTFHNVGFMCVDVLARELGVEFGKNECHSVTAHAVVGGQKVIVAKPLTYMNLSGVAVSELVNKYKIELCNVIVVYDDVDIPLGNVRIRKQGSAGTHNGMRNIVSQLGTTQFARLRIGTGKDTPMQLIDFVLSELTEEDHAICNPALLQSAQALKTFVQGTNIDVVMQQFNTKTDKNQ